VCLCADVSRGPHALDAQVLLARVLKLERVMKSSRVDRDADNSLPLVAVFGAVVGPLRFAVHGFASPNSLIIGIQSTLSLVWEE
jgi:hypothetical protein